MADQKAVVGRQVAQLRVSVGEDPSIWEPEVACRQGVYSHKGCCNHGVFLKVNVTVVVRFVCDVLFSSHETRLAFCMVSPRTPGKLPGSTPPSDLEIPSGTDSWETEETDEKGFVWMRLFTGTGAFKKDTLVVSLSLPHVSSLSLLKASPIYNPYIGFFTPIPSKSRAPMERIDTHTHVVPEVWRKYSVEHGFGRPDGMPAIPVRLLLLARLTTKQG